MYLNNFLNGYPWKPAFIEFAYDPQKNHTDTKCLKKSYLCNIIDVDDELIDMYVDQKNQHITEDAKDMFVKVITLGHLDHIKDEMRIQSKKASLLYEHVTTYEHDLNTLASVDSSSNVDPLLSFQHIVGCFDNDKPKSALWLNTSLNLGEQTQCMFACKKKLQSSATDACMTQVRHEQDFLNPPIETYTLTHFFIIRIVILMRMMKFYYIQILNCVSMSEKT